MHVRDATVGPLSGTKAVSGCTMSMSAHIDAERVGGDLGEDRVGPLADLGAGGQHADAAFGRRLDVDDRREVIFAGSREAGAVHEGREADALLYARRGFDAPNARASRDSRRARARDRAAPAISTGRA